MPHRCMISVQDAILGTQLGTKCFSQACHTSHRGESSEWMDPNLESCPVTFVLQKHSAQKKPPHPPFHTNNPVRSEVQSSPASHRGTGISESHQGDPIPPRRSTQPRLQRSHYPEACPSVWLPPLDSAGGAGPGVAQHLRLSSVRHLGHDPGLRNL